MKVCAHVAVAVLATLACAAGATPAAAASGGTTATKATPLRGLAPTGSSPALAPAATTTAPAASAYTAASSSEPDAPIPVAPSNQPYPGRRLSPNAVLRIAQALPVVRRERARYPGSYGGAYIFGPAHPGRWQVSYFSRAGKEIVQVYIADADGRVLEQWTGFQIAWTMARGYRGAFGRHVNSLYIWLPLCVLFFAPFFDPRRPFRLLHFDLLALLSFSVSLAFFNHANIYASVPLSYPPLVYLLARMLAVAWRGKPLAAPRPLTPLVPSSVLLVGVMFLLGFRIALNVTDSNVIDVGYAGVIGAERIVDGKPLYGGWPQDNEHGDTYGPTAYEAYVPFEQLFGWSGTWDDLPAAHGAAIVFDLLAVALLFLLGRRVRGPALGTTLAYAWVSYPFTLYALESNSNDVLVGVLVLAALLLASSPPARGALAALAGLAKFAPLALAPLLATHGLRGLPTRTRRARALAAFLLAFALTTALVSIPALRHDTLHTIYARTLEYQANRGSPFSLWGLYGGLHGALSVMQVVVVVFACALALLPRRPDTIGLAAAAAAVLIATQLAVEYWFYLYIPWFCGAALLALFGRVSDREPAPDAASEAARSSLLAAAASS